MPKRRPADDRRIYCRPTATGRCPGGHRWAACRSSSGHRPKILSSAERIGRSPNSRPAVAGRRPLHDFYDMVQGRENPAMISRCQKVVIGEKSADHRRIYNPCDVPFRDVSVPKIINSVFFIVQFELILMHPFTEFINTSFHACKDFRLILSRYEVSIQLRVICIAMDRYIERLYY